MLSALPCLRISRFGAPRLAPSPRAGEGWGEGAHFARTRLGKKSLEAT